MEQIATFTTAMAVQNFAIDAFRGTTWISLHNGGGVGRGEVINGGFGMVLDGSADSDRRLRSRLHWHATLANEAEDVLIENASQ